MDKGTWQTVHGVTRDGQNLSTKPPPTNISYNSTFIIIFCCFFSEDSRERSQSPYPFEISSRHKDLF